MTARRPCILMYAATLTLLTACASAPYPASRTSAPAQPASYPAVRSSAPAQSALTQRLDSVMRSSFPADQPGAVALVVRNGEVMLRGAYGMADMELGAPLRPEHVFRIGSITKQFTAAAVLMLAEEGRLTLADPLTRFFPDFPSGDRVTVQHLLSHTSGIRSYTGLPEWRTTTRLEKTVDELIAMFRAEPFDFEPGSSWSYNNSGYILLGAIIEQLSGMSYADFIATRIFGPLDMEGSSYGSAHRITPNRVPGYSREDDAWINAEYLSMSHPYAAGSLLSTVDDLARWDAAITRGALLSDSTWTRAFTPALLDDGRDTGYAAGWVIGRVGDYRTAEHGGGINGFLSYAVRVPEVGLFVTVLANADRPLAWPAEISLKLADLALGGVMDAPPIAVRADRLREYVGVYRIDNSDATRTITLDGDRLFSERSGGTKQELRPIGEDLFVFPGSGTRLRFVRSGGQVSAMTAEPRAGMGDRATRTGG